MPSSVYEHLSWMVAGEAGYGITTMGEMFARILSRSGLYVHGYVEYPSLIRGGHNTSMVRAGTSPVMAHSDKVDILLALNKESIELHLDEMSPEGIIIYDGEVIDWNPTSAPASLRLASLPLDRIVKELGAQRVMRNTIALGACFAAMNFDFKPVSDILEFTFTRKGQEVVDYNVKLARAGYDAIKTQYAEGFPTASGGKAPFTKQLALPAEPARRMVISGNEALALAAIKSGVKFMAAYPMTPVTSIMQSIAKHGAKYNIVMKHAEDEIAAMNMVIGAAHMGVRAMTATSGGGFALMTEALGMAGITENPIVVVEGMRPGPSTGLPTWTDQADLRFVMHASQGEFPRILMAPGDAPECFEMTLKAFNLAEKYQMISMILVDKYVGECIHSVEPFSTPDYQVDRGLLMSREECEKVTPGSYKRFEFTESGVSRRAVPGSPNCIYAVSTDEHKEDGDLDESSENRTKMVDKRAQKLITLQKESLPEEARYVLHGPEEADLTVVSWGSTKGPIVEALQVAESQGLKVNFLQIQFVIPFPVQAVTQILSKAKKTLLIETNSEAQMGGVIREQTGILLENRFLRYDGRPFHPAQILERIQKELSS